MHTGLRQPADSDRFGSVITATAKRAARAALLVVVCLMPGALSAATDPSATQVTALTAAIERSNDLDAKHTVNYPDTKSESSSVTSAADLSLFGILTLGIIGLLWVRRHTSEL